MGFIAYYAYSIHAHRVSLQYDPYGLAHADLCRIALYVLHFRQLLGRKLLEWPPKHLCGLRLVCYARNSYFSHVFVPHHPCYNILHLLGALTEAQTSQVLESARSAFWQS